MAQLRDTIIDSTGFLNLPSGTTAQRPPSPVTGMMRFNTTTNQAEYYSGNNWLNISDSYPEATGGTIVDTEINGVVYRTHYFTNTGNTNFVVTQPGEVEYLIVAGGGGGGGHMNGGWYNDPGGGGGAGGLISGTTEVTAQTYTITVGAGGTSLSNAAANNGGNSSAFGLTAIGGGGGGAGAANNNLSQRFGKNGGSGGGGGGPAEQTTRSTGGTGTVAQGNNGGFGGINSPQNQVGGGGGGAGAPGENGVDGTRSGQGGAGLLMSITGTPSWFAGGGGAGGSNQLSPIGQVGGPGGGGRGGDRGSGASGGNAGQPNTGGGGGGAGGATTAGAYVGSDGGSGVVIVRYRKNQTSATSPLRTVSSLSLAATDIVRDGLIAYIDPANVSSYPGSGTTVFDLSGRGANGTINGNVTFSTDANGCFVFGGANADDISSSLSQDYQDFTMFFEISPNAKSFFGVIGTGRATTNLDDAFRGSYNTASGIFDLTSRNPGDVNDWAYSSGTTYYVNGSPSNISGPGWNCWGGYRANRSSFNAGNSFPYHLGTSAYTNRNFTGKIGVVLLYSRRLSAAEQLQNFNAFRWRYGI